MRSRGRIEILQPKLLAMVDAIRLGELAGPRHGGSLYEKCESNRVLLPKRT